MGLPILFPDRSDRCLPQVVSLAKRKRSCCMLGLALFIMSLFDAGGRDLSPQSLSAAELPVGFGVERYARIWERNPFTLVTPDVRPAQASPFNNLFLASWLNEGGEEVVFVQNSETNEVQRITAEPSQTKLRLIEMHLNPNPRLVEAIISDGKEEAGVKFRFGAGQTASDVGQMPNKDATAQTPNAAELAPKALRNTPENLSNAQSSGLPKTASAEAPRQRIYPGVPRVHSEGGSGRPTVTKSASLKHRLPDSPPAQSNNTQK